jgi:hypothetical protein
VIQLDAERKPSREFAELMAHLVSHGGSRTRTGSCAECKRLRDRDYAHLQRRMFHKAFERRLGISKVVGAALVSHPG